MISPTTPSWLCRSRMRRVAVALLLALPVATVTLFFAYRQEVDRVRHQVAAIGRDQVPPLVAGLRGGSREETEKRLKKMLELPDILFVEIRPDRKKSLAGSGLADDRGLILRRFPLPVADDAPSLAIPSALYVAVSLAGVHERIKDRAWSLFFAPGLAAFAVVFLLAAGHCRKNRSKRADRRP